VPCFLIRFRLESGIITILILIFINNSFVNGLFSIFEKSVISNYKCDFSANFTMFFVARFYNGASGVISGKVTSKETKSAIRGPAFFKQLVFRTITATDGTFTLSNIRPGQYSLVVTTLGYSDFVQTVLVNDEPIKINVELDPKVIQLREVVISSTSAADWKRNYARFRDEFIGTDDNAKNCDVINPKILNLTFHRNGMYWKLMLMIF